MRSSAIRRMCGKNRCLISKSICLNSYEAYDGVADLYAYSWKRASKLLREGGRFSFIVSSSFLRTTYGEPLRRTLKKHAAVSASWTSAGCPCSKTRKTPMSAFRSWRKRSNLRVSRYRAFLHSISRISNDNATANRFTIPHERLSSEAWALKSDEEAAVFEKVMKAGKPLGEYVERKFFRGLTDRLE